MSFYDIVLDFLLMDAFDDLSCPPGPVVSIMQNKWLADSLKESVSRDTNGISELLAYVLTYVTKSNF